MEERRHAHRRGERGTHPVLIGIAAVIILVVLVVIFLLLQKPKQVTPIAVLGNSPSASAAATPTAVPVTVAPTAAPTAVSTKPAFASLDIPHTVSCLDMNGQLIQGNVYPPISWNAINATGITISIDGPGIFGSYGPSGSFTPQDETIPFSCSEPFKHTYLFTTTGGSGPAATKQVTITATH